MRARSPAREFRARIAVVREGRQLDELVGGHQAGAPETRLREAHVATQAHAVPLGHARTQDPREEGARVLDRGHRVDVRLESVEGVAVQQRSVQGDEDVGPANVVEHGHLSADRDEGAGLAVVQPHGRVELVQAVAPTLEDVVHCIGVRVDAHAPRFLGHFVPHGRLHGPDLSAGDRTDGGLAVLHPAQGGIRGLRSRREPLAVARAIPAAVLDTADRHPDVGASAHEDRHVEGAVLLGAEHLLALVEQDRLVGRVEHVEVVDGREPLDLLDGHAPGAALSERDVLEHRVRPVHGEDGQWTVHVGIADAQRLGEMVVEGGEGGLIDGHSRLLCVRSH